MGYLEFGAVALLVHNAFPLLFGLPCFLSRRSQCCCAIASRLCRPFRGGRVACGSSHDPYITSSIYFEHRVYSLSIRHPTRPSQKTYREVEHSETNDS